MPTKKKTTYTLSRAKFQKKLDKLAEKLQDFDIYSSTFNEISELISDVESELADLAFEATDTTS